MIQIWHIYGGDVTTLAHLSRAYFLKRLFHYILLGQTGPKASMCTRIKGAPLVEIILLYLLNKKCNIPKLFFARNQGLFNYLFIVSMCYASLLHQVAH